MRFESRNSIVIIFTFISSLSSGAEISVASYLSPSDGQNRRQYSSVYPSSNYYSSYPSYVPAQPSSFTYGSSSSADFSSYSPSSPTAYASQTSFSSDFTYPSSGAANVPSNFVSNSYQSSSLNSETSYPSQQIYNPADTGSSYDYKGTLIIKDYSGTYDSYSSTKQPTTVTTTTTTAPPTTAYSPLPTPVANLAEDIINFEYYDFSDDVVTSDAINETGLQPLTTNFNETQTINQFYQIPIIPSSESNAEHYNFTLDNGTHYEESPNLITTVEGVVQETFVQEFLAENATYDEESPNLTVESFSEESFVQTSFTDDSTIPQDGENLTLSIATYDDLENILSPESIKTECPESSECIHWTDCQEQGGAFAGMCGWDGIKVCCSFVPQTSSVSSGENLSTVTPTYSTTSATTSSGTTVTSTAPTTTTTSSTTTTTTSSTVTATTSTTLSTTASTSTTTGFTTPTTTTSSTTTSSTTTATTSTPTSTSSTTITTTSTTSTPITTTSTTTVTTVSTTTTTIMTTSTTPTPTITTVTSTTTISTPNVEVSKLEAEGYRYPKPSNPLRLPNKDPGNAPPISDKIDLTSGYLNQVNGSNDNSTNTSDSGNDTTSTSILPSTSSPGTTADKITTPSPVETSTIYIQSTCPAAMICVQKKHCSLLGNYSEMPLNIPESTRRYTGVPLVPCRIKARNSLEPEPEEPLVCCRDLHFNDPWSEQ